MTANEEKIAVVLEGGGKRNAWTSGFLTGAVEKGFDPDSVASFFACSSAVAAAAYCMTGQSRRTREIWSRELNAPRVYHPLNPLRLKRIGDVDTLLSDVLSSLDTDALHSSPARLVANVVRGSDGELLYLECGEENRDDLFKATCSLPVIARPVVLGEHGWCRDGGLVDPFPVLEAYRQGYRRIIAVTNRPPGWRIPSWESRLSLMVSATSPALRRSFSQRPDLYERTWEFIQCPPDDVDIYLIQPPEPLPCSRLDRRVEPVEQAFALGEEFAEERWPDLRDFLFGKPTSATPIIRQARPDERLPRDRPLKAPL